jgi:predicted extracellular nuclease
MADWLATDPTSSGDADILVIGDTNSYYLEDPLTALGNAGFVNLVESAAGLDSYSFQFRGQSGALDHALASASLVQQITSVVEWHINADEPRVLDYNLEFGRDPGLFDGTTPYRSSDHDPLIIGLDLN